MNGIKANSTIRAMIHSMFVHLERELGGWYQDEYRHAANEPTSPKDFAPLLPNG
jgi:hypothetical protein